MVAEAGDLDAVFFGGLEDGEVVIDLVGFVVDEDFDLLGREEPGGQAAAQQLAEHQYLLLGCIPNNINKVAGGWKAKIALCASLCSLREDSAAQESLCAPTLLLGGEDMLEEFASSLPMSFLGLLALPQLLHICGGRSLHCKGGTLSNLVHFSFSFSPSKGVRPASISKASIPTAQISLRGPLSLPCAYSGGRYSIVPTTCSLGTRVFAGSCLCAYPKSHNLTVPCMGIGIRWRS